MKVVRAASKAKDPAAYSAVVRAAQTYGLSVEKCGRDAGRRVLRLVVSPNVHGTYEMEGCALGAELYSPWHFCAMQGYTHRIRGTLRCRKFMRVQL